MSPPADVHEVIYGMKDLHTYITTWVAEEAGPGEGDDIECSGSRRLPSRTSGIVEQREAFTVTGIGKTNAVLHTRVSRYLRDEPTRKDVR